MCVVRGRDKDRKASEIDIKRDRHSERERERDERERERERERQTDRQTEQDRQTETHRDRDRERQKHRETETDRYRETDRDRETIDGMRDKHGEGERMMESETDRDRQRQTEAETDRQRQRETDRLTDNQTLTLNTNCPDPCFIDPQYILLHKKCNKQPFRLGINFTMSSGPQHCAVNTLRAAQSNTSTLARAACLRVKINKRSFEPFCVWVSTTRSASLKTLKTLTNKLLKKSQPKAGKHPTSFFFFFFFSFFTVQLLSKCCFVP